MMMLNGAVPVEERFVISVKTDNNGASNDNQYTIAVGTGTFNYDIEYDGQTLTGQTGNVTLTFPSGAGTYDVKISGSFPHIRHDISADYRKLINIKNWGVYGNGSTSQYRAFFACVNMDITATDTANLENVNNYRDSFRFCSSLTSFPFLNIGLGGFIDTWNGCNSLEFFPANIFDNCTTNNYSGFQNTNLNTQSIDNILISIDASGITNGVFTQSGGQAPSATGLAAKDNLVAKGWTLTYTT
jgi:hypothetical protein